MSFRKFIKELFSSDEKKSIDERVADRFKDEKTHTGNIPRGIDIEVPTKDVKNVVDIHDIAKAIDETVNKAVVVVVDDTAIKINAGSAFAKVCKENKVEPPSIKEVIDDLEEPKKYTPDVCNPKTCWGECDGYGWCDIAQKWQKKIHPRTYFQKNFHPKRIKNKEKFKNKKEKWKKIHNKRKKK